MSLQTTRHATIALAGASVLASAGVGLACVGPLLGIVLGIGGLGFLSRYHWLQLPATIATAVLLATGFFLTYRRRGARCDHKARSARIERWLLWSATLLAIALQIFEHVIFPRL
jgi:predicted lipid-binding transport protein (Tim44 family)